MPQISDKRLNVLLECERKLNALEEAGVDNWEGYGDAMRGTDDDEEDAFDESNNNEAY